jgi:hypothetical protein
MSKCIAILFLSVSLVVTTMCQAGSKLGVNFDEWRYFKLNYTTEKDILTIFGPPDAVKIEGSYDEIKRVRDNGGMLNLYECTLRYEYNRLRGDLNILKGPLGEASSVEVWIENGKVAEVDWEYEGLYRDPAEAVWRKDKSIETYPGIPGKSITMGMKDLKAHMRLYVHCFTGPDGKRIGAIAVKLMMDGISE